MKERQISYREAINEALREEMERDPNVILLGEDIAGAPQSDDPAMEDAWGGVLGVTKGLIGRFGKQPRHHNRDRRSANHRRNDDRAALRLSRRVRNAIDPELARRIAAAHVTESGLPRRERPAAGRTGRRPRVRG